MGGNRLVDAGFLVALLSRRDSHHSWSVAQASRLPPPWKTCEAVLSEAFHLLGTKGMSKLGALLRRGAVASVFDLSANTERVLELLEKYSDVPASLADVCLVRMTETIADPVILTTDDDFRIYRRHGRRVVPCVMPD
jgi:predicted nucleic acid-binding protein